MYLRSFLFSLRKTGETPQNLCSWLKIWNLWANAWKLFATIAALPSCRERDGGSLTTFTLLNGSRNIKVEACSQNTLLSLIHCVIRQFQVLKRIREFLANYRGEPQPAQPQLELSYLMAPGCSLSELFPIMHSFRCWTHTFGQPRICPRPRPWAHIKVAGFAACLKCQQDISNSRSSATRLLKCHGRGRVRGGRWQEAGGRVAYNACR